MHTCALLLNFSYPKFFLLFRFSYYLDTEKVVIQRSYIQKMNMN